MSPIQHFSHDHPLVKVNGGEAYTCDGCNTTGSGTRFSCHSCGFDLHEYCAICPDTHYYFNHPQHHPQHPPLQLVRRPETARHNNRNCNVCGQCIQGFFYICSVCEFDVHPMCTQQPMVPPPASPQCQPAPQPLIYCPPCTPYACYCVGYGFRVCRFR